jgi:succinyl-CoA synthetase alpha subunit
MDKQGVGNFKYFVGISSLDRIATREDRVCVLNILGGESSDVTPVGHAWSGGNVVFGTSPGRGGQVLETPIGDIPVFDNVREGMEAGHHFNCGVVYLPPAGARDGVAELIRVNPELRKIFIVTEKLSVHDAREIRAMGQQNGIDIFGGNSLGVADAWNQVRIGGALGGDAPGEALRRGSIAIFSNSGNFTTTMATYLRMAGWGTTTLISSGKDVYIHYAAPEFAFALANDARSRAAVLYVEPGGTYELDADFTKPVVACVVGRWKTKLTRAVGHAGAMAGGGDDAATKEGWFMEKFGVSGIYTPETPIFSARGAVVTNIAHIAPALTAIMRENGARPDFEPEGNLALKPWFGANHGLDLPAELDLKVVEASPPYNEQIAALNRQIGAVLPRQNMKDASGASQMDARTQVTSLYGTTMMQAACNPFEANLFLSLLHEAAGENDRVLVNAAVAAGVNLHGTPALAAAEAAREAGNPPNLVLAAAASLLGPRDAAPAREIVRALVDAFATAGLRYAHIEDFDTAAVSVAASVRPLLTGREPDARAEAMLAGLRARGGRSVFIRWLLAQDGHPTADAVLAAIAATLAWGPLSRKRVSRLTAETLPWWLRIFATLIGASVPAARHEAGRFCGVEQNVLLGSYGLNAIGCLALTGAAPSEAALFGFQTLVGLLLTNGPGTITAQGAKGAVASDGPETPERVLLNKAMVGFLSHSGYAHGGNGYEGIAFLIDQFRDSALTDPGDPGHGIDLEALAGRCAAKYALTKATQKTVGSSVSKIPCVNHPVFRDQPVNYDPREVWTHELFIQRGEYNIFQEYYHALVEALFKAGVSRVVYCVNIDAVIATVLLKMLWQPWRSGALERSALETAAFTVFLYARMLGCAAEIDDHLNRGRDMDTRTPASQCRFVA